MIRQMMERGIQSLAQNHITFLAENVLEAKLATSSVWSKDEQAQCEYYKAIHQDEYKIQDDMRYPIAFK